VSDTPQAVNVPLPPGWTLEVVEPRPGEIVVITMSAEALERYTAELMDVYRQQLVVVFPHNKVVILAHGLKYGVLDGSQWHSTDLRCTCGYTWTALLPVERAMPSLPCPRCGEECVT